MAQYVRKNGNETVKPEEIATIYKKKMMIRINNMHNGEHLIPSTRTIIDNGTRLRSVRKEVEPSVKDS